MRTKAFFLASISLIVGVLSSISHGQVTTNITSSGLGTAVSPISSGVVTITGGTRAGTNLFHSFGEFSVGASNTANFLNTPINGTLPFTTNILSRVTGGNPSNIFGTIKTTDFGSANLFLINPAGVVFGPNASLSIGGSFHVSTADYLKLADGVRFNAVPNVAQDALLSTSPVAAFGFLDPNPAAIAIQGSTLQVPDGQTLSVVGGEVTIQGGTLSAPNGRVQVAGAGALTATEGEVSIRDSGGAPEFLLSGFAGTGQVQLVNDPAPVLEGATVLTEGTVSNLDGTFHITLLEIGDTGKLNNVVPLLGPDYIIPGDKGKFGGDLGANWFLTFSQFDLIGGETATFQSPGITINNILSRVIGGQPSVIDGTLNWFPDAALYFLNPAGVSFLATAQLGTDVTGSFHVSTADYLRLGTAGAVGSGIFYADATKLSDSVLTSASPTAFGFTSSTPAPITFENTLLSVPAGQTLSVVGGDITVTGGTLSEPGGQINLVSVASPGEVVLPNFQYGPNVNGESFTSFGTVSLSQGATLDVSDYGFEMDGRAGTVLIRGGQFVFDGSFIFAQTFGNDAGAPTAVDVDVRDNITISGGSAILSFASLDGRSGDITLSSNDLTVTDVSAIITGTFGGTGNAGNILLGTPLRRLGTLTLTNDSQLSSATSGAGRAGDVVVHAALIALDGGALMTTDTSGSGPGGDITLTLGRGV